MSLLKLLLVFPVKTAFFLLDLTISKNGNYIVLASKSSKSNSASLDCLEKELNERGFRVFKFTKNSALSTFSFRSFLFILRAKYVYLTHGPGDIKYALYSPRKVVVYVGHGTPVKNFIFTNKNMSIRDYVNHKLESWNYKYFVASSEEEKSNLQKCFKAAERRVIVTGSPRNDLLSIPSSALLNEMNENRKIFLYAPTHREGRGVELFPFIDRNLGQLDLFLKENNIEIKIKIHINEKTSQLFKEFERINLINDDLDCHYYLNECDGLITDYSSLYVDYLLLDRSIIFLDYDFEDYKRKRGFLYDFSSVSPGKHPKSQSDFCTALLSDKLGEAQFEVKERFHRFDSGFTKRLVDVVHG